MKSIVLVLGTVVLLVCCDSNPMAVEKTYENGVEVVLNKLKPYRIEGEFNTLVLEKEFSIDTEIDEIAVLGVTDILGFDVDSEENIFVFKPELSHGDLIHKFNRDGEHIASFVTKGQGPGEVQYACYQRITTYDEIPVVDGGANKLLLFDQDGNVLREVQWELKNVAGGQIVHLANGNLLIRVFESVFDKRAGSVPRGGQDFVLSLYDSNFKWLKNDVDRLHISSQLLAMKSTYMMPVYFWEVSDNNIYIGSSRQGYEIRVYDLNGNLKRKIRKEHKPVKFSQEIIDEFKRITENPDSMYYGLKRSFPEYYPPFQRLFFTDGDGRLYLMTFEKAEDSKSHIFNVFTSDGVYIADVELDVYVERFTGHFPLYARTRNKRLYLLREKESGFKEIVVYKMSWE